MYPEQRNKRGKYGRNNRLHLPIITQLFPDQRILVGISGKESKVIDADLGGA